MMADLAVLTPTEQAQIDVICKTLGIPDQADILTILVAIVKRLP